MAQNSTTPKSNAALVEEVFDRCPDAREKLANFAASRKPLACGIPIDRMTLADLKTATKELDSQQRLIAKQRKAIRARRREILLNWKD